MCLPFYVQPVLWLAIYRASITDNRALNGVLTIWANHVAIPLKAPDCYYKLPACIWTLLVGDANYIIAIIICYISFR